MICTRRVIDPHLSIIVNMINIEMNIYLNYYSVIFFDKQFVFTITYDRFLFIEINIRNAKGAHRNSPKKKENKHVKIIQKPYQLLFAIITMMFATIK